MATSVDICNKALLLLGMQEVINSLTQDSAQAKACNLIYANIRDWCLGVTNWNFARRTATLTLLKSVSPIAPWTSASPAPPWKYEYQMPSDALMIRYITNTDLDSAAASFLGEPKRFVVAVDTIAMVDTHVILCNESFAAAIYTAQMTDPTFWPWYFERLVVSSLAWHLCMALISEDINLTKYIDNMSLRYFDTAIQANTLEGLSFGDTTPEWIQALGINYPYRRNDGITPQQPQAPSK